MYIMLTRLYDKVRVAARSASVLDAAAVIVAIWTLHATVLAARRKFKTTRLRGPPRTNLIYGCSKDLFKSIVTGSLFEQWAKEYGPVYEVPTTLGGNKIVLCDPKAIAHFYARETWTYLLLPSTRRFMERNVGHVTQWVLRHFHVTFISSSETGYRRYKAKPTRGRREYSRRMDGCYLPFKATQILDARIQPCYHTKYNTHFLSFCLQGNLKCNPFSVLSMSYCRRRLRGSP